MPSPVGGIDSIRSDQMIQMTYMHIADYQNEYRNEYRNDYLTLSALGDGVAPAGIFTKIAPMTLWSIGASGVPNNWAIADYEDCEVAKFARLG